MPNNDQFSRLRIKKHDRLQLELKLEHPSQSLNSNVQLDVWFHLPKAIGIASADYASSDFYGDVRSYTRLMTPAISLFDLAEMKERSPLGMLWVLRKKSKSNSISDKRQKKIRQESRLLCCILRRSLDSALEANTLSKEDVLEKNRAIRAIIDQWRKICTYFQSRELGRATSDCLRYVDDAISVYVQGYCTRLLIMLDNGLVEARQAVTSIHQMELEHQRKLKSKAMLDSSDDGSEYLIRVGNLKKYVSSELYLEPYPDKTLKWIRHISLSIAAALAMLWAAVAQIYAIVELGLDVTKAPNMTFLLAFTGIAVLSYVLKDRIKATSGVWISKKISSRFSDRKTLHLLPSSQVVVAETSDQMTFMQTENSPLHLKEELRKRDTSNLSVVVGGEALWFRRVARLHHRRVQKRFDRYQGITDILRINVWRWIQTLDDPKKTVKFIQDNGIQERKLRRAYLVDLFARITEEGKEPHWVTSRIWLNRRGIISITDIHESEVPPDELGSEPL